MFVSCRPLLIFAVFYLAILILNHRFYVIADDESHEYKPREEVTLWLNKIGPYHNALETYSYYSLPFCEPSLKKKLKPSDSSLSVLLEGDELTDSGLMIEFGINKPTTTICALELDTQDKVDKFTEAVTEHYWYQLYIDELPIWGMVGVKSSENDQAFIYTHKSISLAKNGNRIIEVNLTSEVPKPLEVGKSYEMTYSVQWSDTKKTFERRFDRYLDFDFFEHQIHWFSIFNSFMMVIFLCGIVALILMRTLNKDIKRYTHSEEHQDEMNALIELDRMVDESGFKQIRSDVFRAPRYLILYAALLGTGFHLLYLALIGISITLVASMYEERGSLSTLFLVCYSLTSFAAGYHSARFYKQYGGTKWKNCMVWTAAIYPAFCLCIAVFLNFIAIGYGSTSAFSFYSITLVTLIWAFVTCPLVLAGTIFGRSTSTTGDFPCRVKSLRRPIPPTSFITSPFVISLISGIVPFGSIFIELYFVFTSFFSYKFYYLYGLVFLVFLIFLIVTMCITIVSIYITLNNEDYRWHWISFVSGASTAVYVYLYSIYYFINKTHMSGLMQTAAYFGYMMLVCFGLATLGGSIGFTAADLFVRRIYQYIKSD